MIRSFLLLVAVLVAVTPVNAAKRRPRHIVYRPVTRTVTTRTVTTPATTTPATTTPATTTPATTTPATATPATATSATKAPAKAAAETTDTVKPKKSPLQVWAETEAKMMVARRYKGHVRGAPMGTFVGVGFSVSGRVVTCIGSGQLVAQATLRGPDGYYHVRVWR